MRPSLRLALFAAALAISPCALSETHAPRNPNFAATGPGIEALNLRTTGRIAEAAADSLNVSAVTVAKLDAFKPIGRAFDMVVPIEGRAVTLNLSPFDMTSANFKLLVQRDGQMTEEAMGPTRTMRGTIAEIPGAVVAATLLDTGIFARIILPDSSQYWVEPLAERLPDAAFDDHAIYNGADVIASGAVCATQADEIHDMPVRPSTERGGPCGASLCVAQVGCDADRFFYQQQGSTVAGVTNRITSVLNAVNIQYERDVQIRHMISGIVVRTDGTEPYTTTAPDALLNQFANEWNVHQGAIGLHFAHLFTGREVDGNVIGIASLGVICNLANAYGLVQSNCCGSFGCSTDLSAHEIGHNWSAPHCSCTQFTMNPSITCRNVFNSGSIAVIQSFRDSRGCLTPDVLPPPPGGFTLVSPADGAFVADTGPLFDWSPASGVVSYLLEVADNPLFSNPVQYSTSVSQLNFSSGAFADGTTVYWAVTAVGNFGQFTLSNPVVSSFTIQVNPPPDCVGDANNDGLVNSADLSVLLSQFGSNVPANTGGDFNNDGMVNAADLSVLLGVFGLPC